MSELVLAMSCHEQPWALQQWFPQHHLKEPLPKSVAENPDEVERRLAATRCYAGGILRSYQEPRSGAGCSNRDVPSHLEPVLRVDGRHPR